MRPDASAAESRLSGLSGVKLFEWLLEARDQVNVFREAGFQEEEVPLGWEGWTVGVGWLALPVGGRGRVLGMFFFS